MNSFRYTKITAWFYINIVRLFGLIELYQPTYNPHGRWLYKHSKRQRASDNRLQFILDNLDLKKINNFLDVGCQMGYFNFKMAEKNIISHGFDQEPVVVAYAEAIARMTDAQNVGFWQQDLTPETASKLPFYDVISNLSVYHHLVHFQSRKDADKIMQALFEKCNYMIFETGQHGEPDQYWSSDLGFMGDDVKSWFKEYCKDNGFKVIASQDGGNHLNNKNRTIFLAQRL